MVEGLKPSEPIAGSAYDLAIALPRTLAEALRLLRESKPLVDVFGDRSCSPIRPSRKPSTRRSRR